MTTGDVTGGDELRVLSRPGHGVTVGECFAGLEPARAASLLSDQDSPALAPGMRDAAELAASRA